MSYILKYFKQFIPSHKRDSILIYYFLISLTLLCLLPSCSKSLDKEISDNDIIPFIEIISARNNSTDSIKYLLNKATEVGDNLSITFLSKELGKRMRESSQFSQAIEYHQQGLNAAYIINDTIEIVYGLNNVGTDFRRIGAWPDASVYHYRALQTIEAFSGKDKLVSRKSKTVAINGIGNIHLSFGNLDEAEKLFREALQIEKELNSNLGQAINNANIGAIYEKREMYDSAFVYFQRSMEHNVLAGSELGIGLCYIYFGQLYEHQLDYDKAKREYLLAYDVMNGISDKWHSLEATLALARINLKKNDYSGFMKLIQLGKDAAIEIESPEHLSVIYNLYHEYYSEINEYASALENYKLSKLYQDSIHNLQKLTKVLDLRMNYERDKNRIHIADLNFRNEMEVRNKRSIIRASLVSVFILILLSGTLFFGYVQRTKSNKMLKNLNQVRNTFFTNLTHEFLTPITVILGLSRHMQTADNLERDESISYMESIERQGNHLLRLVNQLLSMSKISAGIDNPKWYQGDIVVCIKMIVDPLQPYAKSKNVKLNFTSSESVIEMEFIPNYINDVVQNLISNALKYSSSGDEIEVVVCKINNKQISISVNDTGEGINENDLEHIFNLFYQGKQTGANNGSGIGLSYVRQLVEYMNGKIGVESSENRGSKFTVKLPQYQKQESNLPLWSPGQEKTSGYFTNDIWHNDNKVELDKQVKTSDFDNQFYKFTILLIEDNEDVLYYLKSFLPVDYNIITARDGNEGFELAQEFVPDIIISDIMMPNKDGLTLCRDIRNSPLLNHIPIILLTAKTTLDDRIKGVKYGADAYIKKPFSFDELLVQIETLLENRRILKEKYQNIILNKDFTKEKDLNVVFLQKATDIVYSQIHDSQFSTVSLAEKLSVSSSQLNRKLSAISGYTPSIFITKLRIELAKRKLVSGNDPIGQIAEECGYSDIAYFSRTFKKMTNFSPSQFRRLPKIN